MCEMRDPSQNLLLLVGLVHDDVAVVDEMQVHGVMRSGRIVRGDGIGDSAVRADRLGDELLSRYIDEERH